VVGGVQVVFELLAYGRGHPRNTVAVIVLAAARRRSRHVASTTTRCGISFRG